MLNNYIVDGDPFRNRFSTPSKEVYYKREAVEVILV